MKLFLRNLLLFSIVIGAADYFYDTLPGALPPVPHLWFIFSFFVLATSVFHFMLLNASERNPQAFVRTYMGATMIRLLLYAIIIAGYRFAYGKEPTIIFAVAFFIHYIFFTVFEVSMLLKQLRK